jgi:hypothetical protein
MVSFSLPAAVDVHVDIPSLMELEFDHTVYRLLDDVLVEVAFEMIPAVPSHRRGNADVIVKGKRQRKQ